MFGEMLGKLEENYEQILGVQVDEIGSVNNIFRYRQIKIYVRRNTLWKLCF